MSKHPLNNVDNIAKEILQMTKALNEAYSNALERGFDVLESKDGYLVRTSPDGTSTVIRQLPPKRKVNVG